MHFNFQRDQAKDSATNYSETVRLSWLDFDDVWPARWTINVLRTVIWRWRLRFVHINALKTVTVHKDR